LFQWHALERTEQAKYYEMARKERALHMQLYPGWSARDNYAQQGKKKKRKRDKSQGMRLIIEKDFCLTHGCYVAEHLGVNADTSIL
jgi:hypothetical protein